MRFQFLPNGVFRLINRKGYFPRFPVPLYPCKSILQYGRRAKFRSRIKTKTLSGFWSHLIPVKEFEGRNQIKHKSLKGHFFKFIQPKTMRLVSTWLIQNYGSATGIASGRKIFFFSPLLFFVRIHYLIPYKRKVIKEIYGLRVYL